MEKSPDQIEVKYRLINVTVKKLILTVENTDIDINKCSITIGSVIKFNIEKKLIFYTINILFHNVDDENDKYMQSEIGFLFEIENMNKLMINEKDIKLPDNLLKSISSVAIGTSRGILIERLATTPLKKIILPPINIANGFESIKEIT